jgi:uncharacterized protein YbaP (TraB family)
MKLTAIRVFVFSRCACRAMLVLGVLFSFSLPMSAFAIDHSLEEIYAILGVTPNDTVSKDLQKVYKKYSRLKRHKALALVISPNNYALGYSYKARSELGASQTAMAQCEKQRTDTNIDGSCEILLLGEQLVLPGRILRQDVKPDTAAMAWRLESPNGPLYLIGTVHVLKPSLLPLPAVFDQILNEVDSIALEVNPVLMSDPGRVDELRALMRVDPKQQKKLYDKSTKKLLKRYAKNNGIAASTAYTAPIVINALQASQLKMAALGYSFNTGVEMHYVREASKFGKVIIELEKPTASMATLLTLPVESQLSMLRESILQLDNTPAFVSKLIISWLTGDTETVYSESFRSIALKGEFEHIAVQMLDDRNLLWMDKIDALIAAPETSVIMVGAAHFGGEKGLLALLIQRGLNPVQLTWDGANVKASETLQ